MTITSIFCPNIDCLKLDLITTFTSILDLPTSLTKGMTLNGKLMSLVVRYLMVEYAKNNHLFTFNYRLTIKTGTFRFYTLQFRKRGHIPRTLCSLCDIFQNPLLQLCGKYWQFTTASKTSYCHQVCLHAGLC